ncbi:hypothetical protein EDD11_004316 [Mortierella claussenii]|nr:hypothetical protein EDD11_004316 [Mortierella claussenii]
MAYAMLASLPPVHGLYTSLVPTVLYSILGTSRHMSTGTFAITSLLLGQFAHKILLEQGYIDQNDAGVSTGSGNEYQRRYLPLCLMLTFCVGAIQMILSMARLGRWTSKHLLPTALVSGFNTASAFHIGTHQLKHWLGMKPPRESGVFSMIKTWIWIVQHFWKDTVWASLVMGLAAMLLMYILQRIEYRRRAASEPSSALGSTSLFSALSPGVSPSSPRFAYSHPAYSTASLGTCAQASSHLCSNRTPRMGRSVSQRTPVTDGHVKKRLTSRRRSIVPKAMTDQDLLTVQDVAIENVEYSGDSNSSSSPSWSPAVSPAPFQETAAIPSLNLSAAATETPPSTAAAGAVVGFPNSRSSAQPAPEIFSRPVIVTTVAGLGQSVMEDGGVHPTSPGGVISGLTNTGAFGHRQERAVRSQKSPPSPRVYRYKSFRSPTSGRSRQQRAWSGSEGEQEPLLSANAPFLSAAIANNHSSSSNNNQQQSLSSRRGSGSSSTGSGYPKRSLEECCTGSGVNFVAFPSYGSGLGIGHGSGLRSGMGERHQQGFLYECDRDDQCCQPWEEEEEKEGTTATMTARMRHWWKRWMGWIPSVHFPIPDIFICVVVFTAITVLFDLDKVYEIEVIGFIPTGLPTMAWPPVMIESWTGQDWVPLIWPSLLMAIIVYVMSLSVAKHFGREYGYEVDADQEMLALGMGSLAGSCFGGYVCTGNLTRSAILAQLGAKTPLASIVGSFMVLMSLLWFTVLFERIPNTILAAIVLVALKSLLSHAVEAKRLWRVGRRKEAVIWWMTFGGVIVFSIEVGLAVGMVTVVVMKVWKNWGRWKRSVVRSVKQSSTYQRLMLMLGLQSPLFTTAGRGLYHGDDEDDY